MPGVPKERDKTSSGELLTIESPLAFSGQRPVLTTGASARAVDLDAVNGVEPVKWSMITATARAAAAADCRTASNDAPLTA